MSERLDELKQEATDLGIKFSANIGEDKLQAKIEEYYESQETLEKEIQQAVVVKEAEEKSEVKSAVSGNKTGKGARIQAAKEAAMKTRVVTIIDNDQRVNNQTTSCKVNCTNEFFDLGQMVLPLNTPVEVRQGHIDVLKEIKIPLHTKDPKTGLARVEMRHRYSISYED